jgi:hypothetical protein
VDAYRFRHMAPKDWIPSHQPPKISSLDGNSMATSTVTIGCCKLVARPIPPTTNFRPPLSRLNERREGMRAHLFYAFALSNVHVDRVAVVDPTRLPYSSHSGVLFFPPALLARRVSLSLHRRVFRSSWPSSDAHTLPFSFHYKVCTNLSYSDLIKYCLLSDSLSPADLSRRHGDYFVTSIPCLIPQLDK